MASRNSRAFKGRSSSKSKTLGSQGVMNYYLLMICCAEETLFQWSTKTLIFLYWGKSDCREQISAAGNSWTVAVARGLLGIHWSCARVTWAYCYFKRIKSNSNDLYDTYTERCLGGTFDIITSCLGHRPSLCQYPGLNKKKLLGKKQVCFLQFISGSRFYDMFHETLGFIKYLDLVRVMRCMSLFFSIFTFMREYLQQFQVHSSGFSQRLYN